MQDQQQLWDESWRRVPPGSWPGAVSAFAIEAARALPPRRTLLELGCGPGADSVFFAQAGHRVVATDFAPAVVARNRVWCAGVPGLAFLLADMRAPLPFRDESFDAVYASLSLHYFLDAVTRHVFREIHRVLTIEGTLVFMCKSTDDPLYGAGEEVERDMFLTDGKVRHFFSDAYARDCLRAGYRLEQLWSGPEQLYGSSSAVVKVRATKRPWR